MNQTEARAESDKAYDEVYEALDKALAALAEAQEILNNLGE